MRARCGAGALGSCEASPGLPLSPAPAPREVPAPRWAQPPSPRSRRASALAGCGAAVPAAGAAHPGRGRQRSHCRTSPCVFKTFPFSALHGGGRSTKAGRTTNALRTKTLRAGKGQVVRGARCLPSGAPAQAPLLLFCSGEDANPSFPARAAPQLVRAAAGPAAQLGAARLLRAAPGRGCGLCAGLGLRPPPALTHTDTRVHAPAPAPSLRGCCATGNDPPCVSGFIIINQRSLAV